jgi:UDP-3-O-[3-hydroxymyristoyl] N-acetylglucosamine deacetylase
VQKTLKKTVSCKGVGIHSGLLVELTLRPAEVNTGIVFKRTDKVSGNPYIPAKWDHVVETRLCTKLGNADGVTVSTVEHVVAALAGMGIDNALIEVSGPEVPIMDGSSAPFILLIEKAGIQTQNAISYALRILKTISVEENNGRFAELSPALQEGLSLKVDLDFNHREGLSSQAYIVENVQEAFKDEISKARTWGFLDDYQKLLDAGFSKGASLENTVVLNGADVMNQDGLRYQDELVRHKALDVIGDLYLAGLPLHGAFRGSSCGHGLNNKLLHALFADQSAWEVVTMGETFPFPVKSTYTHRVSVATAVACAPAR